MRAGRRRLSDDRPKSHTRAVLADLALAVATAISIAGLCVALAWIAPLELFPPRP
jgi:hypothetical protein